MPVFHTKIIESILEPVAQQVINFISHAYLFLGIIIFAHKLGICFGYKKK